LDRKTETSSLEKWIIRFFQTEHIDKRIYTIDLRHSQIHI
jgi:hypothetical protein